MTDASNYLLTGGLEELERLRLQARIWEPEAEIMLDRIGIQPGWKCIDLGCGAMGILGPLSHRVGSHGHVVGGDNDAKQLAAAREFVYDTQLSNVEILELDAYRTELPHESFDFTHVRFVFAPVGRDEELLREMLALTRPGGVVAIQEPDAISWNCHPAHPAWECLKGAILTAFVGGGGDFNVGRRTYGMLRCAGLEDVQIRATVIALQGDHPYKRLPIQFATSLRTRILDAGMLSASELDGAIADCEQVALDPETIVVSFIVTQVWGRKPLRVVSKHGSP
jgi:SAM-dependent methyltransferase